MLVRPLWILHVGGPRSGSGAPDLKFGSAELRQGLPERVRVAGKESPMKQLASAASRSVADIRGRA